MIQFEKRMRIAKRVTQEFRVGNIINLGAGVPSLIPELIPNNMGIMIHSENGIIGEVAVSKEEINPLCVDASNKYCSISKEGSFFDSSTSFAIARGGHLDFTVLGALQVDKNGNLANYMVPGSKIIGMGGAMDLVSGAKKVIIAMEHCTKNKEPRIVESCTYPLTGIAVVHKIVTELAVIEVTKAGLLLTEIAEESSIEEVQSKTGTHLIVSEDLKRIAI